MKQRQITEQLTDPSKSVRTLARVNTVHPEGSPGPAFWLDWVLDTSLATQEAKRRLLPGHQIGWIDIFEQAIQTVRYRDSTESLRPLCHTPNEFTLLEIRDRPLIAPLRGIVTVSTDQENCVADVIEVGISDFTAELLHGYYLELSGKYQSGYPAQTSETTELLLGRADMAQLSSSGPQHVAYGQ